MLRYIAQLKPDLLYLVDQFDAKLGDRLIRKYPTLVSVHTVAATCPASSRLVKGAGAKTCSQVGGWGCLVNNLRYGCLDYYGTFIHQYLSVERFVALRDTYKTAHRFVAVSQYIKEVLIANGWDEKKISLVYNPVDPITTAETIEVPENLLVCASRLHPIKGIDRLIEAGARMRNEKWTLWICGEGPELNNLRELTEMHRLQDKIVFKGRLSYEKMLVTMKHALAVIQPNVGAEAFGLSAAEASALGIPVIAANISALNETLIPNQNALFYDADRPEELADCILRVLRHDPICDEIRQLGPPLIKKRFGPDVYLNSLINAFENTIESFRLAGAAA